MSRVDEHSLIDQSIGRRVAKCAIFFDDQNTAEDAIKTMVCVWAAAGQHKSSGAHLRPGIARNALRQAVDDAVDNKSVSGAGADPDKPGAGVVARSVDEDVSVPRVDAAANGSELTCSTSTVAAIA